MLLKNATIVLLSPPSVERADIRVLEGSIAAKAKRLPLLKGEESVDLTGKFTMPGMVNAHTHLYSALARGMSAPKQAPRNFLEILRKIWWKLDESLDEESIYYSALVGSIEAAKLGTTTLFDHHASPNHIIGSLDTIRRAMSVSGLRGILCYETTDRGGSRRKEKGLEENERFVAGNASNPMFRGTIGAHASFTVNDNTMKRLGELSEKYHCGVHIHAAEDATDVLNARNRHRTTLGHRLRDNGILSSKSILAHGVHFPPTDLSFIRQSKSWLVHNPRSNMNNAVGYAPLRWFGGHSAMGTDGFPADMYEECKIGFFRNQESDSKVPFARLPEMLHAGQRLVGTFFGREFGTLDVGSAADLIVLDYCPPTPLTSGNILGHFLFGMSSRMVVHSMINGRWVVFNRELVGIHQEKVMEEAGAVARKLWKRVVR